MKQVKKVFNVEYDLTSEEFKAQKQDEVSEKYQNTYKEYIVKVTTFCAKDKQIVIHTTQETSDLIGAGSKELAQRHMKEQSFLTMDDDMTKTYEINIMKSSDILDYETVLNIAQAKANKMFEKDDSKIPLVTVIDYKWSNSPTTISASLFSEIDEEGNILSLINPQAYANVAIGDGEAGEAYNDIDYEITDDNVIHLGMNPFEISSIEMEVKNMSESGFNALWSRSHFNSHGRFYFFCESGVYYSGLSTGYTKMDGVDLSTDNWKKVSMSFDGKQYTVSADGITVTRTLDDGDIEQLKKSNVQLLSMCDYIENEDNRPYRGDARNIRVNGKLIK